MIDGKYCLPFCFTVLISPVMGAVGESPVLPRGSERCSAQMNELVLHLKETAEIEGVVLRITKETEGIILKYMDFSQHMRCVDGTLHIDIRDDAAFILREKSPRTTGAQERSNLLIRWVPGGGAGGEGALRLGEWPIGKQDRRPH